MKDRWQELGACRLPGVDKSVFYPEGTTDERADQERRAKEICSQCGVQEKCREVSIANMEQYGVWGGLGEKDRAGLLKS